MKHAPFTGSIAAELTHPRRLALNETLFFLPFPTSYLLLFFSTPTTSDNFNLAFITFTAVAHPVASMFPTAKRSSANIATREVASGVGVSTAES